jgi:hypothetical protein
MAEEDDRDEKGEAAEAKNAEADAAKDEDKAEPEEAKAAEPSPKPAAKKAGAAKRAGAGKAARGAAKPVDRQQKGGSLGKSMILFVLIIGGLVGLFALLGREQGRSGPAKPKWTTGQTVDVEITLIKTDRNDLSCAFGDEVAGKHCAFEAQNKPWSKGPISDDKTLLKPYTTTDHVQFAAAGLWSEPALAPDKLPPNRFSVKCKYTVEGTIKQIFVRWDPAGPWHGGTEWYAGKVSDCKINP